MLHQEASVKIDEMILADLEQVTDLAEQLGYPNVLQDIKRRYEVINKHSNYALFVARDENAKVLGWVQVNAEPCSILTEDKAEVVALIVDQGSRNRGIGAALLKQAERWAKSKELKLMRIRSNLKRTDAHRFYQKNGYEIKKSWHLFVKLM